MQSEVGQRAEALETAREAVKFSVELAGQNRAAFLPELAMSLNNLATMQSAVGQRAEALETGREAVKLYRELHEAHSQVFAEDLAKALGTMSGILGELSQHSMAVSSLADGMRTILPEAEKYPQAYLSLCLALARNYFAAAEAAHIAPDSELLSEVMRIVGPHLPQTDSGEPAK
jgi:tetratricopeptide (TPR) repeat protein